MLLTNNSFFSVEICQLEINVFEKKKHISLQQPMMKLSSAFLQLLLADGVKNSPQ